MNEIIELDIEKKIKAIDPAYITNINPGRRRITSIFHAKRTRKTFIIVGDVYLFYTEDNFETLKSVDEVNHYFDTTIIPATRQVIKLITETMAGTIIIVGYDWRKESPTSTTDWDTAEKFSAFRKPYILDTFSHLEITLPGFTRPTNDIPGGSVIDAGYIGATHTGIAAFTCYAKGFFYSLDEGFVWRYKDMSAYAASHVHSVAFQKSHIIAHSSKIFATIGDDFTGAKAGVSYADTLDGSNDIINWKQIFAERPGYRLVALTVTARKIFCGNESAAGGVIAISNDLKSLTDKTWEYMLGREQLDFHQFGGLIATDDGIIFAITDCYPALDTPHKGMGGNIYISTNEGASYISIPLFETYDALSAAYDGSYFYVAAVWESDNIENRNCLTIYKIPKPSPYDKLAKSYISKVLVADLGISGNQAKIAAGSYTPFVDMSEYDEIAVNIETFEAGKLRIQASPFKTDPNWTPQGDLAGWYDIKTIEFKSAGKANVILSALDMHNKLFRIYNPTATNLAVKYAFFTGRKK